MSEVSEHAWEVYAFPERDPLEVHVVERIMKGAHTPFTTCTCQPRIERVITGLGTVGYMVSHGEGEERPT